MKTPKPSKEIHRYISIADSFNINKIPGNADI